MGKAEPADTGEVSTRSPSLSSADKDARANTPNSREAPGTRLRHLLATGETHVVASSYDALTARICASIGFEIHHLTGFGAAAALTGGPDIGLVTMTEMVDSCRRICSAVSGPVIADGDTGHGNLLNVMRTIQAFEGAGAAGVHIEDQVTPKRCGHTVSYTHLRAH